jgi:hypothetical protein
LVESLPEKRFHSFDGHRHVLGNVSHIELAAEEGSHFQQTQRLQSHTHQAI